MNSIFQQWQVFAFSDAGDFSFANFLARLEFNSRLIYLSFSNAVFFIYMFGIVFAYFKHAKMTVREIDAFDDEKRWTKPQPKKTKGAKKEEKGKDAPKKEEKKETKDEKREETKDKEAAVEEKKEDK